MFCAFCGTDSRTDNLERHCISVHNEYASALMPNEEVKMPEYVNCDVFIKLYPSVVGFVKVPAAVWKNPGP